MHQRVPIFRVPVNLQDLDKQLANGILLEAVHAAVAILVGQDEAHGRVEVRAGVGAPAGQEALDDVPALFVVGEFAAATGAGAGAASWAGRGGGCCCGGGFAVDQGVKEVGEEVGEAGGFGVVARAVGETRSGVRTRKNVGWREAYCSSSSARLSGPLAYCCSSSSMASTSGDLARLVLLMLDAVGGGVRVALILIPETVTSQSGS